MKIPKDNIFYYLLKDDGEGFKRCFRKTFPEFVKKYRGEK